MAFDISTARPVTEGDGFDQSTARPVGGADPKPSIAGAADVLASGVTGMGENIVSGIAGMVAGRDIPQSVAVTEAVKGVIPDWEVGAKGQEFNQWLSQFLAESYQDYVPDTLKPHVEKLIADIQGAPEGVFTKGMDIAARLDDEGYPVISDVVRSVSSGSAATLGALPTIAEGLPALKIPAIMGRSAAIAQRATSPEKREIAKQLGRDVQAPSIEGDYIPSGDGKELAIVPDVVEAGPSDPWTTGQLQVEDDLGLAGYTTTTAPYELNKYGKVVDSPRHKIAQDAGFSDALLGFTERLNPETRVKANKMLNYRERLYELPETSSVNDPTIITGESLAERLDVIKKVNERAGEAIDRYVNKTLGNIELNTLPLMDRVSELWGKKGVDLNTSTWEIDFGDMELNKKGQVVINKLLDEMKEITANPTGRTVHNLKRRIDEDIAYGKTMTGLDAKTQGLLKDFRRTTKEFLENQFPEYGRANAEYSQTVDVIDRMQKAAGKVDIDGKYSMSNLGRMSRAIMSQRVGRDTIMETIEDLSEMAGRYRGREFKDNLTQQVHLANQLDEIWGPSRATGFAGQTKQGVGGALAETAIDGGISGGLAVTRKARDLLKKKQMEDKKKFKAMRELLKPTKSKSN